MSEERHTGRTYDYVARTYPEIIASLQNLGTTLRAAGPLDEKTSQLVQLAAAATSRSEGAVHSHTRRAKEAGATPEEIYHTVLLLVSTIGFPQAMAAISWCRDILAEGEGK